MRVFASVYHFVKMWENKFKCERAWLVAVFRLVVARWQQYVGDGGILLYWNFQYSMLFW